MRSLTSLNEKWAKSVEHAEEKRKEPSKTIRPMRTEERNFGKESQSKWLAFIVIWWEECGRKKGKAEEIKERPFGHLGSGKKREVPASETEE